MKSLTERRARTLFFLYVLFRWGQLFFARCYFNNFRKNQQIYERTCQKGRRENAEQETRMRSENAGLPTSLAVVFLIPHPLPPMLFSTLLRLCSHCSCVCRVPFSRCSLFLFPTLHVTFCFLGGFARAFWAQLVVCTCSELFAQKICFASLFSGTTNIPRI